MLSYDSIMWVYVNMKKFKNKSTETKTSKRAAKRAVKSYSGVEKFKKFMKRYWYWPVTLVVLLGVSLGWCYGIGLFDGPIDLIYDGPETIDLYVNSYFNLGVKASNGKDINYYVEDGFEDIISVDSLGKVYGKKEGLGKIVAEVDGNRKYIVCNISIYSIIWVLQVGDRITYDDLMNGIGKHVEISEHIAENAIDDNFELDDNIANSFVLKKYKESESIYESGYEIIGEGDATIRLLSNDTELCKVDIYAYNTLEKGQRQFEKEIDIYDGIENEINLKDIHKTIELTTGDKHNLSSISFDDTGYIIYYGTTPGILKVYQNGNIVAAAEGTSIISVLCIGEKIKYENFKINVKLLEILFTKIDERDNQPRDIYIHDIIKESELSAFYGGERVYEYRTNSNAFNVYYDENGEKCFEAVKLTDTQDAFIIAYDRNGIAVFKFKVNIIEKPEDE